MLGTDLVPRSDDAALEQRERLKSLDISDSLSLPINCVTQKLAILGTSGSGKTYAGMKLAELMLEAGAQIVAIDPVGVWYSLRLAANGKDEGFRDVLVIGGDHGDLPLTPESGALVAKMLAERAASAVIDVSQFITGETSRFLRAFGEQFFESKKRHVSPVHMFLEECQVVVPQNPERDEAVMLARWERLIKFGRNYGCGFSMISQQPQSVNKKVLNQAGTLFAMRTVGAHERKAILSWVKDVIETETDLVGNLPKLPTGTAHVWSPEWLKISRDVKIAKKITFDASATPEVGSSMVQPRPLKPIDIEQFKSSMAELIEKAKQDDPGELRKRIKELERKLTNVPAVMDMEKVQYQIDRQVYLAQQERDAEWNAAVRLYQQDLEQKVKEIIPFHFVAPIPHANRPVQSSASVAQTVERRTRNAEATGSSPVTGSNGKLRAGAERMLAALVQWAPNGMLEGQMRSHAGMKKSGTFTTYMSDLRTGGYIEVRDGHLYATDAGISYFGGNVPSAPQSTSEVLAVWEPKLRDGARRILRFLVQHRGKDVPLEDVAEGSGMTKSGTFTTYLSDLRTARLIVTGRGCAAANKETLFL